MGQNRGPSGNAFVISDPLEFSMKKHSCVNGRPYRYQHPGIMLNKRDFHLSWTHVESPQRPSSSSANAIKASTFGFIESIYSSSGRIGLGG